MPFKWTVSWLDGRNVFTVIEGGRERPPRASEVREASREVESSTDFGVYRLPSWCSSEGSTMMAIT